MISKAVVQSILDLCLPRECQACGTYYESRSVFCHRCEAEITALELAARCRFCSMPATLPGAPCAQCLGNGLPPFDQIVSLGVFKDAMKSAIHRMKYNNRWMLAERLADRLIQREDVRGMLEIAEVLVPVPLHRAKHIHRGFNQAEVIARRVLAKSGKRSEIVVALAGARIRATESQATLHQRTPRFENLRGAFVVTDPIVLADKHVVVIDDVMTTGATLVSFARTLKAAKPASISAILLAVADPKGRAFEVI